MQYIYLVTTGENYIIDMNNDTIKRSWYNLREYSVLNLNVTSYDTRNARSVTSLARESIDSNDQFRGFTNGDGDFLSKSLRPLSEIVRRSLNNSSSLFRMLVVH